MGTPPAEIEVDEALVRRLLADQHPDLAGLVFGARSGWDNFQWRLGDELAVRLPRRQQAVVFAENEHRWLPELAPRLPLPIPAVVRLGRPADGYRWPWSVVRWIPGSPGDQVALGDVASSAERLGRFLRALHRPAPAEAPHNPYRSVPLADRADLVQDGLTQLGSVLDVAAVRRVWEQALAAPTWTAPPTWIHGDLHPANTVIVDGVLAGVIDFGDVCAGDPATDVAAAWMLLASEAVPTFAAAYGGIDEALDRRARGWAVFFGLILLCIEEPSTYKPIGRATLARLTSAPAS